MTEEEIQRSSRPERPRGFRELRRIVAANMRYHRQLRGWTLNRVATGLAPYLGQLQRSTIAMWENTRHDGAKGFTIEELYALCRVFDITLARLLDPPELLDMDPIEYLPGEESGTELAAVLDVDDGVARLLQIAYSPPRQLPPSQEEGDDAVSS